MYSSAPLLKQLIDDELKIFNLLKLFQVRELKKFKSIRSLLDALPVEGREEEKILLLLNFRMSEFFVEKQAGELSSHSNIILDFFRRSLEERYRFALDTIERILIVGENKIRPEKYARLIHDKDMPYKSRCFRDIDFQVERSNLSFIETVFTELDMFHGEISSDSLNEFTMSTFGLDFEKIVDAGEFHGLRILDVGNDAFKLSVEDVQEMDSIIAGFFEERRFYSLINDKFCLSTVVDISFPDDKLEAVGENNYTNYVEELQSDFLKDIEIKEKLNFRQVLEAQRLLELGGGTEYLMNILYQDGEISPIVLNCLNNFVRKKATFWI